MKKKLLIIAVAVVVLIALVLGGFPLFSRLVLHRSQAATLLIWQFDKRTYLTGEALEEYLEEKRLENGAPYVLPDTVDFTVSTAQKLYGTMQVFILNGEAGPDAPVIWYFPGGAYIDQPAEAHWRFLDLLSQETGAAIYVPVYPKLPDHDAEEAYASVTTAFTDLMTGTEHGELIFMGDSAGGGMAISLAMQLRDTGLETADSLILLSPWVDVTMSNPEIVEYDKADPILNYNRLRQLGQMWAGSLDTTDPVISPLYGDLSGLGHVTLFTTTAELLYPDLIRFRDALEQAGTPCETIIPEETMFHTWPLFGWMAVPECQEAFRTIVNIINNGSAV